LIVSLLTALEGCINGYESLHIRAGMLQCDISLNNLMINEEDDDPSWPAFLIDLDLAIKENREELLGARGKTGTRAFMAIGVLLDKGTIRSCTILSRSSGSSSGYAFIMIG
jgi:hypothetical protein